VRFGMRREVRLVLRSFALVLAVLLGFVGLSILWRTIATLPGIVYRPDNGGVTGSMRWSFVREMAPLYFPPIAGCTIILWVLVATRKRTLKRR